MEELIVITVATFAFFMGYNAGKHSQPSSKPYHKDKNPYIFLNEETLFVEPTNVQESFSQSKSVDDFINRLK